jgi:hypothetical protein
MAIPVNRMLERAKMKRTKNEEKDEKGEKGEVP